MLTALITAYHSNAITGKRRSYVYCRRKAGDIDRSTDGGSQWTLLDSPDPKTDRFLQLILFPEIRFLLQVFEELMYRSVDRGDSWKQVPESLHKNMNSVYFAGNDVVLAAGNDGAFLRSRDGGRTFLPSVRKNRLTVASVVEAADGAYVLVGAGGVEIVTPDSL